MGTIELAGMEFKAYHGCLEEERINGNTFVVDFVGKADFGKAAETDDLADTIDYGVLYDLISSEMAKPSNLLENVAGRIVEAVRKNIPEFTEFKVTVSKKNPPVNGPCCWSRVSLEYRQS